MALYRATQLFLNRIMTGRVPPRAFFTASGADNLVPGDAGASGAVEGLQFRDLIDPVNRAFDLPIALRGPAESISASGAAPAQPTVRCVVQLDMVGMVTGQSLHSDPLFMNRNFELDVPLGDSFATPLANALVNAGLIASAGALVNAGIPAALNTRLAGLPVREPGT